MAKRWNLWRPTKSTNIPNFWIEDAIVISEMNSKITENFGGLLYVKKKSENVFEFLKHIIFTWYEMLWIDLTSKI